MGVPLERRPHGSFYRREGSEVISDGDKYQEKRREENSKMIKRGKGVDMHNLPQDSTINIQGRRTRGRGRRVNPKNP